MITLSCAIVLVMLIWFNSDAIVEYGSLFGLGSILDADTFYCRRIVVAPASYTYPIFLKMEHNCFATRLLSCRLCFCIFISILTTPIFSSILLMPAVCVIALILYGIITKLMDLK